MGKKNIRNYLASNEFFSKLDKEFVEFAVQHAKERELTKGEMLFRQGQSADKFHLLITGRVVVEIPSVYGPSLELQNLGEGQVLGWSWFIPPYEWHFQARAEEDSTVIEFDGRALREHCEEDKEFGYELLKRVSELMSERLTAARRRMMDEFSPTGFA